MISQVRSQAVAAWMQRAVILLVVYRIIIDLDMIITIPHYYPVLGE